MSGRYNDELSYADFLIASRPEEDIEAELITRLERDGKDAFTSDLVDALRKIDQLAIVGDLERERRSLAGKIEQQQFDDRGDSGTKRDLKKLQYLLDGLKSPDPSEREDSQRLFAKLEHMSFQEARDFIATTRKPQGRKGRPSVSPPWRKVQDAMCRIRELVAQGIDPVDAARQVANDEGGAGRSSRADYLKKLFKKKQSLRE